MSEAKFRVLIVGGGPVGLVAAHIFAKLDIDFLVLEKYNTVTPNTGASLALWPQTVRVFDQLGLWDAVHRIGCLLTQRHTIDLDGHLYNSTNIFQRAQELHGYGPNVFHRHDLLQCLHDTLPAELKGRIMVDKNVVEIENEGDSMIVRCSDGFVAKGSVIIGADGVHSKVRSHLRSLAYKNSPEEFVVKDESPFQTSYRVLYGNASKMADLTSGHVYESHGSHRSTQLFVGRDKMWFFVYEQLDTPTRARAHYNQADADEYAARLGELHLTEHLRFSDIYSKRHGAGLTNLEEGVLERWSRGRLVLVGDAAHKVTPNLGWGFNSGVQDLVAIANRLDKLRRSNMLENMDTGSWDALFAEYQSERMDFMTTIANISAKATRTSTWQTWLNMVLDYYVFPALKAELLLSRLYLGPKIQKLPVLDWLPEPHFSSGELPWTFIPNVRT